MRTWALRVGLGLLGVLAVAALVAWWWHTYHLVEHERERPPAGEASYNPLYALRLALQDDGVRQSRGSGCNWTRCRSARATRCC